MNPTNFAIQIIPDLTIDEKYSAIIEDAMSRIQSFTGNALRDNRIKELFALERSSIDPGQAKVVLEALGRLVVGFQFEIRPEADEDNFRVYEGL